MYSLEQGLKDVKDFTAPTAMPVLRDTMNNSGKTSGILV